MHNEFIDFLKKYAVVGTAIGIVTGGAVTQYVKAIVANLLQPVLDQFLSKSNAICSLNAFGACMSNVIVETINFIIIMVLVFVIVKFFISKFMHEDDAAKAVAG